MCNSACCTSCREKVDNFALTVVHFFEKGFVWVRDNIHSKTPWWLYVVKPLALLTFLIIPLNITVNFVLSYRLDPVSFFQQHSNYDYKAGLSGGMLVAFWIHKIGSIMWNMAAITQVMLLTLTQPVEPQLHRFNGYIIGISSLVMAICGCILMANGDARYDQFTAVFVLFPAVVVFICAPWLLFDRTRRLILGPNKGLAKVPHMVLGFILCLPPLAMMLQFIFYSMGVSTTSTVDYTSWQISMYFCMIAGMLMLLSFGYHVWLVRNPGRLAPSSSNGGLPAAATQKLLSAAADESPRTEPVMDQPTV